MKYVILDKVFGGISYRVLEFFDTDEAAVKRLKDINMLGDFEIVTMTEEELQKALEKVYFTSKSEILLSNEVEQLKEDVETKIGILKILVQNEKIKNTNEIEQLFTIHKEYEQEGTSLVELRLFYDDILLALKN